MFTAVAIAGAATALAAAFWPAQEDLQGKAPAKPVTVQVAKPGPTAAPIQIAPSPDPVETATHAEAAEPKPTLAIEHHDADVDYRKIAAERLADDDSKEAFVALRKYLFDHAATSEDLIELVRIGRELKEFDIADLAVAELEKSGPLTEEIVLETARLRFAQGDLDAAAKAAKKAIKLDSEDGAAWNLAGRIAMEKSQWERAEMAFRRAAGLEPTDGMIHNNLGLLYIHMKRGEDAVEAMQATVDLFDDVPDFVYNNLGLAYEQNGRLEDARDAFEKALAENPDYSRAQANLDRVVAEIEDFDEHENLPPPKGESNQPVM
jgi:Flp pilus assembly protein TadD